MREVQTAVIVRESNIQLLMYSLDIIMCKSIYTSMDFQNSEGLCQGPEFSPDYIIDYHTDYLIDYINIT